MRKFILIDPSLCDLGGHYFEYAARMLDAAIERGCEPILAANCRARRLGPLPWPTFPVYRYGYFEPRVPRAIRWARRLASATRETSRLIGNAGWPVLSATSTRWRLFGPTASFKLGRKRRAFWADSLRLFQEVSVSSGDVVFLPNACEGDMLGLADLLHNDQSMLGASWHLLFRRDLPAERAAYRQSQRRFQQFISRLNGQRVSLYTDTDPLSEQYNRLGVARFNTLPIPVWSAANHRRFPSCDGDVTTLCREPGTRASWVPWRSAERSDDDQLVPHGTPRSAFPTGLVHVVYLGDARAEKGYHWLPQLVRDAKAAELPVRFTIQSNFNVLGGDALAAKARTELASLPPDYRVDLITEPLASDTYRRLLVEADVVVLPYDARAYALRSSGVFVEALAAGKPVIVRAGTWLAGELRRAGDMGAICGDCRDLSRHLAEIIRNYRSYQAAARAFSARWSVHHSPRSLLNQLIADAGTGGTV